MIRSIGASGLLLLALVGCNTNNGFQTGKAMDGSPVSAKRVSGSDVAVCHAEVDLNGDPLEVYGWDGDGDHLAMIPTNWTDIYAPVDGYLQYLCMVGADGGVPVGYVLVETDADIGADCDYTDAEVGSASVTAYVDADNDGLGTGSSMMVCGTGSGTGYSTVDGDCNDTDPLVGGPSESVFSDFDRDGFGIGSSFLSCTVEMGQATVGGDCDDLLDTINPEAIEICDDLDNNCDETVDNDPIDGVWAYTDADSDGFGAPEFVGSFCGLPKGTADNDTDCDDSDADTFPGAAWSDSEIFCENDDDGDGYGDEVVTGTVVAGTDCDDGNDGINPGATDVPADSIDQDCSGVDTPAADPDSDGDGEADSTDCNDSDDTVFHGASESCNSVDDDCDGLVDDGLTTATYYLDADGDTYGVSTSSISSCSMPSGYVANSTDCNDSSATVHPGASESCNSVDDDCDGLVDDGLTTATYYLDADGDTYGVSTSSISSCSMPSGYVANSTDCNDGNSGVNPAAVDVANNGLDDNCDGTATDYLCVTPDSSTVSWRLQVTDMTAYPYTPDDTHWETAYATGMGQLCASISIVQGHVLKFQGPFDVNVDGTYGAYDGVDYWLVMASSESFASATLMGSSVTSSVSMPSWDGDFVVSSGESRDAIFAVGELSH